MARKKKNTEVQGEVETVKVAKSAKTKGKTKEIKIVEAAVEEKEETRRRKDELPERQMKSKVFNKYGVRSMYELLGGNQSPYEQTNVEDYTNYLVDLNFSDLERHATELAIIPRGDRDRIERELIKQFEIFQSEYFNVAVVQQHTMKKPSKAVLDILSLGR